MKQKAPTKKENKDSKIEKVKQVIELVANGFTFRKAREQVGIGNGIFLNVINSCDEMRILYTHAREGLGEASIDFIDEIEQKLLSGEIDAGTARVLIDAEKWKASKFYPKMYGEKQQVDMTVQSFDLFAKAVEEKAEKYEAEPKNT